MTLFSELQALMAEHKFMPRIGYGQNFITDERLLDRMVAEAQLKQEDTVLEVGCGTGFLTSKLLEHSRVIGFEKDSKMAEILKKRFFENKNFTLRNEDFTAVKPPKFGKMVSLPPYGISTGIMMRLFASAPGKAVLVLQKEFVEKVMAEPGFWDYGYVSVLTSLRFERRIAVGSIPPKSFWPSPRSYSALVVLDAKKKQPKIKNAADFIFFVKNVFRFRNKNFRNALENAAPQLSERLGIKGKAIEKALAGEEMAAQKVNLLEPGFFPAFYSKISK